MKLDAYAPEPLNKQAGYIVDAQTDIKQAIKQGIFGGLSKETIQAETVKIIDKTLKRITNEELRKEAEISLKRFADKLYKETKRLFPFKSVLAVGLIELYRTLKATQDKAENTQNKAVERVLTKYSSVDMVNGLSRVVPQITSEITTLTPKARVQALTYESTEFGLPLREWSKTYMKEVEKTLDTMVQTQAKDPNDPTERNSLRNKAEMLVRYESHIDEINDFKAKGTKLVVCSVHADCSDRCKDYQGKIYSLDGTSGETNDGRKYVPLEYATQNPKDRYTTKQGITYQNGLFGFNCRHKLFEYKENMVIPSVSEKRRKQEDKITKRQRELEREVIYWREQALILKGIDNDGYKHAKQMAKQSMQEYEDFCIKHNRPYYIDRTKIL